jgi:hypothetical protein
MQTKLERLNKAALYEAHQELHKQPTAALEALVVSWERKSGLEKLGAAFQGFQSETRCQTDHPQIRVDAAKRILADRQRKGADNKTDDGTR